MPLALSGSTRNAHLARNQKGIWFLYSIFRIVFPGQSKPNQILHVEKAITGSFGNWRRFSFWQYCNGWSRNKTSFLIFTASVDVICWPRLMHPAWASIIQQLWQIYQEYIDRIRWYTLPTCNGWSRNKTYFLIFTASVGVICWPRLMHPIWASRIQQLWQVYQEYLDRIQWYTVPSLQIFKGFPI